MDYDEDFRHMTEGLRLEDLFYVRAWDHTHPIPTDIPNDYPIFGTFCELGLRNRLRERRTSGGNDGLRFIASSYISDRPKKLLQLHSALDDSGRKQYVGENDGFLLVWLSERPENINQDKQSQMESIEALSVGDQFWLRQSSRSSSEIAQPSNTNGYPVFNMPVFTGVRDRLNKNDRAVKKKIVSGELVLCEIVVKVRRPWQQNNNNNKKKNNNNKKKQKN